MIGRGNPELATSAFPLATISHRRSSAPSFGTAAFLLLDFFSGNSIRIRFGWVKLSRMQNRASYIFCRKGRCATSVSGPHSGGQRYCRHSSMEVSGTMIQETRELPMRLGDRMTSRPQVQAGASSGKWAATRQNKALPGRRSLFGRLRVRLGGFGLGARVACL